MQARAFRLNLKTFREVYHYLVLIQYELCQGPYRNAFQVLIDDVLMIYEETEAFTEQTEALERLEPPDQLNSLSEAYERSWTRPTSTPQPEPSHASQPRPSGLQIRREA